MRPSSRVGADACRHLPGARAKFASRTSPSPSCSSRRRDRPHRGERRVRLGPAHLPRPREDRTGLHDRPRVRRHRHRRRRRGARGERRRPRARLLSDRLRTLLLLPAGPVPQVRLLAHVRARRDARLAAGHAGRAGARAERRPRAAQGARGHERRRRAVRRRRDGHRLPRRRRKRPAARRHGGRARPRAGRAVRRAGRASRWAPRR